MRGVSVPLGRKSADQPAGGMADRAEDRAEAAAARIVAIKEGDVIGARLREVSPEGGRTFRTAHVPHDGERPEMVAPEMLPGEMFARMTGAAIAGGRRRGSGRPVSAPD
jgi:hypothetical protein